ncbi:MAG: site-specific integrase, partial [Verrucomicrobiaceae bacterium]
DPQIEKQVSKAQAQDTVGGLVARYLASHGEKRLGARTLVEVRRALTVAWKPLHELPVQGVQRHTVATRLAEIAEENGPFAANRARSYLSAMFNWAIMQGVADQNPVIGTGKVTKEVSRDRVLSDAELAMVWQQAGDGDYGRVIRLLILTGQRREEVAAMPWPEINFKDKVWSIDANRTKNGRPHDVPLSGAALSLLDEAGRREGRELAFGAGDGPFSGWSKCKAALDRRILATLRAVDKKAKAPPPWRIHDIRRTVATRMSDLGVQPHVVEAALNHISGHRAGVAGVYNRAAYSAEKRAALDLWARHIEGIVHGRT